MNANIGGCDVKSDFFLIETLRLRRFTPRQPLSSMRPATARSSPAASRQKS